MEILDVGLEGRRRAELEKHGRDLARLRGEEYVPPKSTSAADVLLFLGGLAAVALVLAGVIAWFDATQVKQSGHEARTAAYVAPIASAPWQVWKAEHDRFFAAVSPRPDHAKIEQWKQSHPEPPRPAFE